MLKKYAKLVCYVISYAYILAAAQNDGWTGGFFAIPFAVMLISLEYKAYCRTKRIPVLTFLFLLVSLFVYSSDRSDWSFMYDAVGEDIIVTQDGAVTHGKFFPLSLNIFEPKGVSYFVKQGSRFTITNQYKTGFPDFGVSYIYRVKSSDKELEAEFIKNAKTKPIDWSALDNEYKELPLDSIYINTHLSLYEGISFDDQVSHSKHILWSMLDFLLVWILLFPALIVVSVSYAIVRD